MKYFFILILLINSAFSETIFPKEKLEQLEYMLEGKVPESKLAKKPFKFMDDKKIKYQLVFEDSKDPSKKNEANYARQSSYMLKNITIHPIAPLIIFELDSGVIIMIPYSRNDYYIKEVK